MKDLKVVYFDKDNIDIIKFETLRWNAFSHSGPVIVNNYFKDKIEKGEIMVVGCYYLDELIAGAYISPNFQSLYIDELFVRRDFQRNQSHIGTFLMRYILNHKEEIEKYFNCSFSISRLDNKGAHSFYQSLGYKDENNVMGTMKRKI